MIYRELIFIMSKIVTLTDVKHSDELKIKNTINLLVDKIKMYKIDEFKNKYYIEALEKQVTALSKQLKELHQTPKLNMVDILKDVNNDLFEKIGLSKTEMNNFRELVDERIKKLM